MIKNGFTAIALLLIAGPAFAQSAAADGADAIDPDCSVIRYMSDGTTKRSGPANGHVSAQAGQGSASAESSSHGGQASSSVSVSSHSGGGGHSSASSSSRSDGAGRTVTTTRDNRGCTVTIDERTQTRR